MRDRFLILILFLSSTLLIKAYSGGDGTQNNPYQIANTTDLIYLSNHSSGWNKYFIQTADITFDADSSQVDWDGDGSATWDAGVQLGFSSIGYSSINFQGNYNGQNHIISNLYINRESQDYVGLFGYTNNASMSNLGLIDFDIKGKKYVGGLVGYQDYGTVNSSYSTGAVSGNSSVGGLVGYQGGGTVNNCFWDTQTSGQNTSDGGTGKTTAQMKTQSTFTSWDFTSTWNIGDGISFNSYPYLKKYYL